MNISNLFVYHLNQDDPKKCTALKLVRFGLVKKIDFRHIRRTSLVLNPLSTDILSKSDANIIRFIKKIYPKKRPLPFRKENGIIVPYYRTDADEGNTDLTEFKDNNKHYL